MAPRPLRSADPYSMLPLRHYLFNIRGSDRHGPVSMLLFMACLPCRPAFMDNMPPPPPAGSTSSCVPLHSIHVSPAAP